MPRIVDHAARRREVARAARQLILQKGLDRVTVREVAATLGFSTTVVSHYFRGKRELMFLVFQETQGQAERRFRQAIEGNLPVLEALETLLPRDPESRDSWRVWFAFWSMTLTDEEFGREQVVQARKTSELVAQLLEQSGISAEGGEERITRAQRLFAVLTGIATQATHDPEGWPVERQRKMLRQELDSLSS